MPDYFPSPWGSIDDYIAVMQKAQQNGHLVMPYTNPTFWDEKSPTVRDLISKGITIQDIAVIDATGQPVHETYGGHVGIAVSPYSPIVEQRNSENVDLFANRAGNLFLFLDQIGARRWLLDYNKAAPDRISYMQGWLASELQQHVLSRYADSLVTGYIHNDAGHKTTTSFGDLTVVRNIDPAIGLDSGPDTIAILGAAILAERRIVSHIPIRDRRPASRAIRDHQPHARTAPPRRRARIVETGPGLRFHP